MPTSTLEQLRELARKAKDTPEQAAAREISFVYGTLRCEDPLLQRETVIAALKRQL